MSTPSVPFLSWSWIILHRLLLNFLVGNWWKQLWIASARFSIYPLVCRLNSSRSPNISTLTPSNQESWSFVLRILLWKLRLSTQDWFHDLVRLSFKNFFDNRVDVLNLETDAANKATIQVDVRKLSLILNLQSIDIENAIICEWRLTLPPSPLFIVFSEDEALVLHVILAPAELGTITVYLSVVLDLSRLEWRSCDALLMFIYRFRQSRLN